MVVIGALVLVLIVLLLLMAYLYAWHTTYRSAPSPEIDLLEYLPEFDLYRFQSTLSVCTLIIPDPQGEALRSSDVELMAVYGSVITFQFPSPFCLLPHRRWMRRCRAVYRSVQDNYSGQIIVYGRHTAAHFALQLGATRVILVNPYQSVVDQVIRTNVVHEHLYAGPGQIGAGLLVNKLTVTATEAAVMVMLDILSVDYPQLQGRRVADQLGAPVLDMDEPDNLRLYRIGQFILTGSIDLPHVPSRY